MPKPSPLSLLLCAFLAPCLHAQSPAAPQPPVSNANSSAPVQPLAGSATAAPDAHLAQGPAAPAQPAGDTPQNAVSRVISMFTPNEAVLVEATGKPLPTTGSWGVQVKFPDGLPRACIDNNVPCAVVFYRVPEDKVICAWTMGFVKVVQPGADGTMVHVNRLLLLDENESAARYTLRKAWGHGESRPQPVVYVPPDYPQIAREAHVGGIVQVRIEVGPDGLVRSAAGVGGPDMLQKPVIAAVQKWKYEPMIIGGHPTSFRVDEKFNYDAGHVNMSAGMDPSGKVILDDGNPREAGGFRSQGATGTTYSNCTLATGCLSAAPPVPK